MSGVKHVYAAQLHSNSLAKDLIPKSYGLNTKIRKSQKIKNISNVDVCIPYNSNFSGISQTSLASSPRSFAPCGMQTLRKSVKVNAGENAGEMDWDVEWARADKLKQDNTSVTVEVTMANRGGVLVRMGKLKGFIPKSQIDPARLQEAGATLQSVEMLANLVGQKFPVKVMDVNPASRQVLLSERAATKEQGMSALKDGEEYSGVVRALADYGAFVDINDENGRSLGVDGLVHISELSWDNVSHPREVLAVGDQVQVKVMNINEVKGQVSLSIRQLLADPLLETLDTLLPVGSVDDSQQDDGDIPEFPGLAKICAILLEEEGVEAVTPGRQVIEARVVSQDLELWMTNVTVEDGQYNLIVRMGRQVQELCVATPLDREEFKNVVRRVSSELMDMVDL
eukprot:CAMPEP_0196588582 /NCGR_PEP_ID=MMETSP1081-20130531/61003_1 /TAXON_ID=36882 /ORGANISM="Pyramimonas amylifera, Strain CCMP720" /LENGTH=396 /DNA_ID=CAMNT_0041911113 /DNA_START=109 /DNA_END=1299 /DNA_ORIENTATION=-